MAPWWDGLNVTYQRDCATQPAIVQFHMMDGQPDGQQPTASDNGPFSAAPCSTHSFPWSYRWWSGTNTVTAWITTTDNCAANNLCPELVAGPIKS
jgi:hypothetical protein